MNFVFEDELRRFHRQFDKDYGPDRQKLLAMLAEHKTHASGIDFDLELRPPDPKRGSWGGGSLLRINTAEDFDQFVLGAMAELSDTGAAPAGVTYDGVMQLSRQIGESLKK